MLLKTQNKNFQSFGGIFTLFANRDRNRHWEQIEVFTLYLESGWGSRTYLSHVILVSVHMSVSVPVPLSVNTSKQITNNIYNQRKENKIAHNLTLIFKNIDFQMTWTSKTDLGRKHTYTEQSVDLFVHSILTNDLDTPT